MKSLFCVVLSILSFSVFAENSLKSQIELEEKIMIQEMYAYAQQQKAFQARMEELAPVHEAILTGAGTYVIGAFGGSYLATKAAIAASPTATMIPLAPVLAASVGTAVAAGVVGASSYLVADSVYKNGFKGTYERTVEYYSELF